MTSPVKTGRSAPRHDAVAREAQFTAFLESVVDGDRLGVACKKAGCAWGSVSRWIAQDDDYAARYQRARTLSATAYEDRAAREAQRATPETVNVARLRVETYKWRAVMADPKGHSDRATVEHTGSVGHHLDTVERDARLGSILGGIETRLITAQATVIPDEMTDPEPENAENHGKTPEPQPAKAKRGDTKATPKRQ